MPKAKKKQGGVATAASPLLLWTVPLWEGGEAEERDAELNKTTLCPRQGGGGGGGRDVMGRPIRCTCGYHVSPFVTAIYNNIIVDIIIDNTFYMHPGQSHTRYICQTKLNTTTKLPIITGIVDVVLVLDTLITVCIIYTM